MGDVGKLKELFRLTLRGLRSGPGIAPRMDEEQYEAMMGGGGGGGGGEDDFNRYEED